MDIGTEGTCFGEIAPELTHPTFVHRSLSSKCKLFSLAAADMLCNLSHHVLSIDKNYSIDWMEHLQFSVIIKFLLTDIL